MQVLSLCTHWKWILLEICGGKRKGNHSLAEPSANPAAVQSSESFPTSQPERVRGREGERGDERVLSLLFNAVQDH